MAKKKIVKLTDEQYYKYIMSLKEGTAMLGENGEPLAPDSIKRGETDKTGE